jgi:hypothetical protein
MTLADFQDRADFEDAERGFDDDGDPRRPSDSSG